MAKNRSSSLPQLRHGHVLTTDGTIGVSATGQLNAASLHNILHALPEGTWELVCHPGYNDAASTAITTRLRAPATSSAKPSSQKFPHATRTLPASTSSTMETSSIRIACS